MSTLQVEGIKNAAASSNAVTLVADGTCTAKITNNLSNRNLIINGACNVAQRGQSATTDGMGTVDRFKCLYDGTDEAPTQSQHALTSSDTGPWAKGFKNSFHITNGNQTGGAGSADSIGIFYEFEAQDIAYSGWNYTSSSGKITLQFWVKSSVAQNFYGYLRSIDGTQRAYAFETGALTANTWTKITKTIAGDSNLQFDSNNALGFQIILYPFAGGNLTTSGRALNTWINNSDSNRTPDNTSTWYTTNDSTFEITGIQFEVGDTATDFEHLRYGDEFARCQRYYYKTPSGGYYVGAGNGTTNLNNTQFTFPVAMRAQPASMSAVNIMVVTSSSYTTNNGKTPSITQWSEMGCGLSWSSVTGTVDNRIGAILLNGSAARVVFNSEL